MAIEESKISDLIASYEKYAKECRRKLNVVDNSRAGLYRTIIKDLEALLPRKTLADLNVVDFTDLTGTIVEYRGMQSVVLVGNENIVVLFTFTNPGVVYADPTLVYPLDEDRIWNRSGVIL